MNSLVVAGRFNHALRVLDEHKENYGPNNRLLYLLDYATVLHISGDYEKSSRVFEAAKKLHDNLYTISASKQFKTWLVNDYYAPYRGEDFERVIINIFQALNFVMMGHIDGALVEARNVDATLSLINAQYKADQKNVYKEDAFARLLMGILYEHKGGYANLNDAYISYKKAVEIYEGDYRHNYQSEVPKILKENILAAAQFMGEDEYQQTRKKFPEVDFLTFKEKENVAEVYVFYYYGLSPIKHQVAIPIPLPNGLYTQLAFPHYDQRKLRVEPQVLSASRLEDKQEFKALSEEGENIEAIAVKNLKQRRVRVISKAALRAGAKYVAEDQIRDHLKKNFGRSTADVFGYVASLYNISSEQADLRSWQTLPAQIRIARLWLDPGVYQIYFGDRFLGSKELKAGAKEYFIIRTTR